ncbi:MAG: hypothetical protein LBS52_08430 [Dysgonamonadaceae bacterium]|nr:hypothetical protein [Dysgonamonadaceae bacterium]
MKNLFQAEYHPPVSMGLGVWIMCEYANVRMNLCAVIPFPATTRNLTRNPLGF